MFVIIIMLAITKKKYKIKQIVMVQQVENKILSITKSAS